MNQSTNKHKLFTRQKKTNENKVEKAEKSDGIMSVNV